MIAAVQSNQPPTSYVMSVAKFERFFRIVAGLDVDKQNFKRYGDFINQKLCDLPLRGQAAAKANGRVIMESFDLTITNGVQECIHEFEKLDEEIELRPILHHLAARPPLDIPHGEDADDHLPEIVGGLSVAVARALRIIDPNLRIRRASMQKCFRLFDLLLSTAPSGPNGQNIATPISSKERP